MKVSVASWPSTSEKNSEMRVCVNRCICCHFSWTQEFVLGGGGGDDCYVMFFFSHINSWREVSFLFNKCI